MARFSNTILGSLNFFIFLLSIPILSSGIWLRFNALTQCEVFFHKPMIALGAFLMIIAIIGLIGSCCKVTWLLWFYVVVMFLLIICVLCFTFFAFVVTSVGSGEAIPGKAYKEYRLEDYFGWMQDRVNHVKHWDNIRSCLLENGHICNSLELFSANETFYAFYKHDLTAFESGCCKPSNDCNFIYINATTWYNTTESTPHKNSDCQLWDNDKKKLCYNCNACKAGFLDSLKDSWKIVANVNIIFIIILAVFFAMGCYVFINTKREATYYVRSNGLDNP